MLQPPFQSILSRRPISSYSPGRPLPLYGLAGLLIILVAEILMLRGIEPVATWFTPIVWTGYIFFVDGLVWKITGSSLIHDRRREFLMMLPLSVGIWLIFEAYNLHLRNWHYLGVPPAPWRYIGFFWSFATIAPGILETAALLQAVGWISPPSTARPAMPRHWQYGLFVLGAALLIIPLLLSSSQARYLFGMVWLGFIFLLEPINYRLGAESLLADWRQGDWHRTRNLLVAGLICGFLWEFWNFWAHAKWIYDVPILSQLKIFEMPILGFLGFPPFALEVFSMYQFIKYWLNLIGARV